MSLNISTMYTKAVSDECCSRIPSNINQTNLAGASEMDKRICVVLPPHLSDQALEQFQDAFRADFNLGLSPTNFISYPEAVLLHFIQRNQLDLKPRDKLLFCHMEEEITVFRPGLLHSRLANIPKLCHFPCC
jgi:hypothetical protein